MEIDRFKTIFPNKKIFNLFCILFITVFLFVSYSEVLNMYFTLDEWCEFSFLEASSDILYTGSGILRPVRLALLDLMHSAFGLHPLPYHAIVLSLHIINSILVFFIVGRIAGDDIVGLLASCLFATSWIHSEAIVFILQHDILLTTFCILCLMFFYYYRVNPTWPSYVLALVFFALALGTKESVALFLAPLLYLVDRYIVLESEGALIKPNLSRAAYIPFLLLTISWAYFIYSSNEGYVKTNFSVMKTPDYFLRSVTFCFSFPLFTESPRFGIINPILLAPLYFLSPLEIRSRVSLLMASLVVTCLPTSLLFSPAPRHLYFSAIFSMAIFAVVFYYGALQIARKIRLADSLCKLIVIFYVSLLAYYSYIFVDKQIKDYSSVSRTSKNIADTVTASFPKGTRDIHIIFINYPASVSKGVFYSVGVTLWGPLDGLLGMYYKGNVGIISYFNLPELWDAKSRLFQPSKDNTISPREFEELTNRKGNKVYLFDPRLRSIHDVTGKDYTYVKELFHEYR